MDPDTQYRPDFVTPPGETLQETLEALGIAPAEAAGRLGVSAREIDEILRGKVAITSETAIQLEQVTSVSASFWSSREARYQAWMAKKRRHYVD